MKIKSQLQFFSKENASWDIPTGLGMGSMSMTLGQLDWLGDPVQISSLSSSWIRRKLGERIYVVHSGLISNIS